MFPFVVAKVAGRPLPACSSTTGGTRPSMWNEMKSTAFLMHGLSSWRQRPTAAVTTVLDHGPVYSAGAPLASSTGRDQ